jgi:hypothetical protein
MKRFLLISLAACAAFRLRADSTIDPQNRFSHSANAGWIDWRGGNGTNGAVIGEFVCSGYLYAANLGWISLGGGNPANGIQYHNNAADDFGVNYDGMGNLRGYAYGANIGWISFEDKGAPKIDLQTGQFSGYIYSANIGWISLSSAVAQLKTTTIAAGADSDSNGLPDAWEYQYFGHIHVDPNADADGDGSTNLQEYLAGTNPLDPADNLKIAHFTLDDVGGSITLSWPSKPSRFYLIQQGPDLGPFGVWTDSGLGPIAGDGTTLSRTLPESTTPFQFFRVQALRPLGP